MGLLLEFLWVRSLITRGVVLPKRDHVASAHTWSVIIVSNLNMLPKDNTDASSTQMQGGLPISNVLTTQLTIRYPLVILES